MDKQLLEEVAETCGERASFYRLASSLYLKEATDDLIDALEESVPVIPAEDNSLLAQGWRELAFYLKRKGPDPRTDLAVDYARCMLSAGIIDGEAAVPYESIYTSSERLAFQAARDKVRAIYLKNGINVDESLNLPEDHLAFELEFIAIMSERAQELCSNERAPELLNNIEVQRAFLGDHLSNWLPALEINLQACARTSFYLALTHVVQGFVELDAKLLDEIISLAGGKPYEPAADYVKGTPAPPDKRANVANAKHDHFSAKVGGD